MTDDKREGWRCFAADGDSLVAPFMAHYWPKGGTHKWLRGTNAAVCHAADHRAPAESCTCGFRATESLLELLQAVQGRKFLDTAESVLDVCGVIARVELSGVILEGVDIPADDPPTTWRASRARVVELHLTTGLDYAAAGMQRRYAVPVAVYDADEWPGQVAPLGEKARERPPEDVTGYLAATKALGSFGRARSLPDDVSLRIGRSVVTMMRDGISRSDLVHTLFGTHFQPTLAQAERLADAATTYLAPDMAGTTGGIRITQPIPPLQVFGRSVVTAANLGRTHKAAAR